MNFEFYFDDVIPHEITIYDTYLNILNLDYDKPLLRDAKKKLIVLIERIGVASAKAQGLKDPITTYSKLQSNENQRIYLLKDKNELSGKSDLVGLLRVGKKVLFIYDSKGNQHELTPLCVLDFYIHTTQQRKGYGKKLFDTMLNFENVNVNHIAIDRPSDKSMKFLHKHYGLKNPILQMNKFVIFDEFFESRPSDERRLTNNRRFNNSGLRTQSTNSNKSLPPPTYLTPLDFYPKINHEKEAIKPIVVKTVEAYKVSETLIQPQVLQKPNSATKLQPIIREAPKVVIEQHVQNNYDPFPSLSQKPLNNFDKELYELKTKIAQNKNIPLPPSTLNKFIPFPTLNNYQTENLHRYGNMNGYTEKYRKTRLW